LIKLPRAELKLWLISLVAQSSLLLHTNIRKSATASWIVAHHTLALLFLGSAARAILGFFMASRSDLCHHHLTLIYSWHRFIDKRLPSDCNSLLFSR